MAEERDDQVHGFLNRDGIDEDKQYVINALLELKEHINAFDQAKVNLFGASSLRDVGGALSEISKGYNQIAKAKEKVIDISKKEVEMIRQLSLAEKYRAEARKQEADARKSEYQLERMQRNDATKPKQEADAYDQLKASVEAARKSYRALLADRASDAQQVERAKAHYLQLKDILDEVNQSIKNVGKAPTQTAGTGGIEKQASAVRELKEELDGAKEKLSNLRLGNSGVEEIRAQEQAVLQLQGRYDQLNNELKELIAAQRAFQSSQGSDATMTEEARLTRIREIREELRRTHTVADNLRSVISNLEQNPNRDQGELKRYNQTLADRIITIEELERELIGLDATQKRYLDTLREEARLQAQSKGRAEKVDYNAQKDQERLRNIVAIRAQVDNLRRSLDQEKVLLEQIGRTAGPSSQAYIDQQKVVANLTGELDVLLHQYAALDDAERQRQQIQAKQSVVLDKMEKERQKLVDSESAYAQFISRIKQLQGEIREYQARQALGHRLNVQEQQDLERITKEVQVLQISKARMDLTVAGASRNVSGYRNNLFSLQQILREIPSAAYGSATFISAISNNIPILADEISELNRQNKELARQGQRTQSVIGGLARSFFSWQTALVAGVSILAIYGQDIIRFFDRVANGVSKLDQASRKLGQLKNDIEEYSFEVREMNQMFDRDRTNYNIDVQINATAQDQVKTLKDEWKGLNDELQRNKESMEGAAMVADMYGNAMKDAQRNLRDRLEKEGGGFSALTGMLTGDGFSQSDIDELGILEQKAEQNNASNALKSAIKAYSQAIRDYRDAGLDALKAGDKVQETEREKTLKVAELLKEEANQRRIATLASKTAEADIIKAVNQDILAEERSSLQQRITAIEQIKAATIAAARAQMNNVLSDPTSGQGERSAAISQYNAARKAAEVQANRDIINERYAFFVRLENATQEAKQAELDLIRTINEEITEQEGLSLNMRMQAHEQAQALRIKQAEEAFRSELRLAGLSDEEIDRFMADETFKVTFKRKTNEELRSMQKVHENEVLGIVREGAEGATEIWRSEIQKQKTEFEEYAQTLELMFDAMNLDGQIALTNNTIELNKQLLAGEIAYGQYIKQKSKLDKEFYEETRDRQKKMLQQQIGDLTTNKETGAKLDPQQEYLDAQRKRLELEGLLQEQQRQGDLEGAAATEKQLQNAKLLEKEKGGMLRLFIQLMEQLLGLEREDSTDKVIARIQKIQELFTAIKDTVLQVVDGYAALAQAQAERKNAEIDEEIEKLEERSEKELELAEKSGMTEEQKEVRIAQIRERAEVGRQQLEERKKRNNLEAARADKAASIMRVTIGGIEALAQITFAALTASAMGNWTQAALAWGMLPIAAAAQALQVAAVAATPLPKYADGTTYHPGGPAIMGDGGRQELVREPSGEMWLTQDKAGVYNLAKGSVVYPDARKALASQVMLSHRRAEVGVGLPISIDDIGISQVDKTLNRQFSRLIRVIKEKPVAVTARQSNRDLLLNLPYHLIRNL